MICASAAFDFCFRFFLAFLYSRHFWHLLRKLRFWDSNQIAWSAGSDHQL